MLFPSWLVGWKIYDQEYHVPNHILCSQFLYSKKAIVAYFRCYCQAQFQFSSAGLSQLYYHRIRQTRPGKVHKLTQNRFGDNLVWHRMVLLTKTKQPPYGKFGYVSGSGRLGPSDTVIIELNQSSRVELGLSLAIMQSFGHKCSFRQNLNQASNQKKN